MKLSQLHYFVTVCRYGSIARAVDVLHISQPSISAAIRELEHEFGVNLFIREGKSLTLTHEGQSLFEQAEDLLKHAEKIERQMLNAGHNRKTLRIGVPPMIGSLILPQVFSRFSDDAGIHLEITEAGHNKLVSELKNTTLDLAFLPHDGPVAPELGSAPIQMLETVFVTSENNPLAARSSVSFPELRDNRLILFQSGFFQNTMITRSFRELGIDPNILTESSQLSTVISVIRSGIADGFLFRNVAEAYSGIVPISLDPRLQVQISACWNRSSYMNTDMLRFIEAVRTIRL